jgi:predicted DNA binding protein
MSLIFGSTLLAQTPTQKLDVIYFHATRRCPTCMAIEENTRKTLDTYFSNQLKNGTIKLTVINVDEDKNKVIAEKYEATGSALFLTKTNNGKENKNDMTDFAFSCARNNPDKFISGLKDKINELLK